MRDIKYKAFIEKTKEMIDVDFVDFKNKHIGEYDFLNNQRFYPFSEIKLREYTGLTDKDGTEIYEGDILKHKSIAKHYESNSIHEIIGEVTKEIGMTYVRGVCNHGFLEEEIVTEKYGALLLSPDLFEVIGNTYEHPELLEGDSQ